MANDTTEYSFGFEIIVLIDLLSYLFRNEGDFSFQTRRSSAVDWFVCYIPSMRPHTLKLIVSDSIWYNFSLNPLPQIEFEQSKHRSYATIELNLSRYEFRF